MKTVFTSHEIAHVWANQSAPHGKSPGAMSFNGPVIYSYQTAMARHIEHKGKRAIILNVTSYSATTSSKHAPRIRSAIHGHDVPVFEIGNQQMGASLREIQGKDLFAYALKEAAEAQARAGKARLHKGLHEAAEARWLSKAQEINAFYGLRRKVDTTAIVRLRESAKASERKAAAEQAKRDQAERERQQCAYDAWLANLPAPEGVYLNARLFPVAFRVEGEDLVSTFGARVPLQAARVAYRFATGKRGTSWAPGLEECPVGHYRLNAINAQGIVAGCHRITWAEIERLAPVLA